MNKTHLRYDDVGVATTDKMAEEFEVMGVYARCRVQGTWYWWVLWGPPHAQVNRHDHWQPESVFRDTSPDGTICYTSLWLAFETVFPRSWGNVLLLDPTLQARIEFPFEFYAVDPEPITFPVTVHRPAP